MENLAPAGNREALERADAAGADAVYLGYAAFSARAGAGNFDRQGLEEAVRYAHARHMRVYVTLNTLVKDRELPEVAEVIRLLREVRADAVLVQDAGILRMIRSLCPGLDVHASTQMAIHNRTGAAWCLSQGMTRAVLARECSLEEIRKCAETGIEIEVFGHGAQCVAVSGECLFSSMVGERSGNRGRCAQPCRKEYLYRGRRGAWLSPRDVCLRDDLPALQDAGVASVKLEGRAKRPEYTAVVTAAYRKGLDSLEAGGFRKAGKDEQEGLRQIFNRGGFMKGYAFGCEDAGVIWPERVSHCGVPAGRVEQADSRFARVRLERDLADGDELEIRNRRGSGSLIYAGEDTPAGGTALVRLREGLRAETGDEVYRLTSAAQMREAAQMTGRRVTADLFLRAVAGEPLTLRAADGENEVTVQGGETAAARTRPAQEEELRRNLARTGDTLFVPGKIVIETEGAFVPSSEINRIRREALAALEKVREEAFAPDCGAEYEVTPAELPRREVPPTAVVRTAEQAQSAREHGLRVVWDPEDWRADALARVLEEMPEGDWLQIPRVCTEDTLQGIRAVTERYKGKLGGIVLGTIGQLGIRWPVPYGAGSGIPVMNRQAAAFLLEAGCEFVTASPELTGKELEDLTAGGPPVLVTVFGRTQLMLLHHCPARTALGCTDGHRDCRMCDIHHPDALRGNVLEDGMGHRFPLLRQRLPEGCLVRLMNGLPTEWTDRKGIRNPQIELTTETKEETGRVLHALATGTRTGMEATGGHWSRPVE